MELTYQIQNYAWGKKGRSSKVANLYANAHEEITVEENQPYAELWLGSHINGPSSLKSGPTLTEVLSTNPQFLGEQVRKHFGDNLPFLFKVLSVNQALSIQAHPSKKQAEELHRTLPDLYKDPNHKPELAIALTSFEALCGFKPLEEIYNYLKTVPELKTVTKNVAEKYETATKDFLKEAFRAVLDCPKKVIAEELQKLLIRFKTLGDDERLLENASLIETLNKSYPEDVGCFMVYFLNYLKLKPFEAVYLEANLPHAYLFGDCVECMACSDNVVRAGLTPKFIDIETLCEMVTYYGTKPEEKIFQPEIENEYCQIFKPPVPDFAVAQIKLPTTALNYTLTKRQSASILLVIQGIARGNDILLKPGVAVFLPSNEEFSINKIEQDMLIYQGMANI